MKVYSRSPVSNLRGKFDFSHIAAAGHSHGGSLAAYAYANGWFHKHSCLLRGDISTPRAGGDWCHESDYLMSRLQAQEKAKP